MLTEINAVCIFFRLGKDSSTERPSQGDRVPGIFLAGLEKLHPARKTGIYFHSLEFLQNLSFFFNFRAFFAILCPKLAFIKQNAGIKHLLCR